MTHHSQTSPTSTTVVLPAPNLDGPVSLEAALQRRRSCRDYAPAGVTLAQAGQLLWATQGVTEPERGRRTAASAGARYPLELIVVAGQIAGLPPGLYRYWPHAHALDLAQPGDLRLPLARLSADQTWMADAAFILAISAVFARTEARYGRRGRRYVHLDAGIAVANASLQATALGFGSVVVGAFDDDAVADLLGLRGDEAPLLLLPVGHPAAG